MKTCQKCGAVADPKNKFCAKCGTPYPVQEAKQNPTQNLKQDPLPNQTAQRKKFCPNCGGAVGANGVCMACGKRVFESAQTGQTVQNQSGSYQNQSSNQAYQNQGQSSILVDYAPVKKRHAWPFVMAAFLIVLIFLVGIYALFFTHILEQDLAQEAAEDYVTAMHNQDADDYLDYLADTYDSAEDNDTLAENLAVYFEEGCPYDADNAWLVEEDVSREYELETMSEKQQTACEKTLKGYDLTADFFVVAVPADDSSDGDTISLAYIDEKWYAVDAMEIAETYCLLNEKFEERIAEYVEARASIDVATLSEMVPDDFWSYLNDEYGVIQEQAVEYTEKYLTDLGTYNYLIGTINGVSDLKTETPVWMDAASTTVYLYAYDYGFDYDICTDIGFTCTFEGTLDSFDTSTEADHDATVTFTHMEDDTWLLYDAAMMFDFACDYIVNGSTENIPDGMGVSQDCLDQIDAYFDARSMCDTDTLIDELPETYQDGLEDLLYDCFDETMSEADVEVSAVLILLLADYDPYGYSYVFEPTERDNYTESEIADWNDTFGTYGIEAEDWMDIYGNMYILDSSGEVIDTYETYVTFAKYDGEWCLFETVVLYFDISYYLYVYEYDYDTYDDSDAYDYFSFEE